VVDLIIRKASSCDIESHCKLYFEFHEFHVRVLPERLSTLGSPTKFDSSELSTKLQRILDNENAAIFIAEIAGQSVGLVEVYIRQDEPNLMRIEYTYGHLRSLIVLDSFRRRGIGTRLVDAVESWAKSHGATEMRLDTWEFSGDPVNFYESIGYKSLKRKLVHQF